MIPRLTHHPLRRRVIAAFVLVAFATGSVLFWNDGRFDRGQSAVNFVIACAGFFWMHHRWKAQERRALTPRKVKDIFS